MAAGGGGERGADPAHSRAGDQDIAGDFANARREADAHESFLRIARDGNLLDVDDGVLLRCQNGRQ